MEPLSRITEATVAVLEALSQSDDPCWGLLIIKSSGKPAGSVYPILERLETAGWITSNWETETTRSGPRRRYYELTDEGGLAAHAAIANFRPRAVVATVARRRAATTRVATTRAAATRVATTRLATS